MKKLIIALVLLAVIGGALIAFTMPSATLLAGVPGRVHSATPFRNGYLLAAGEAGLYQLDARGAVTPIYKVTGQHVIDVAALGDAVYALAHSPASRRKDLQVVDIDSGAIVRSIAMGGSVVDLAGVLANGQVVVVEHGQVRFIEPDSDRTLSRVPVFGGMLSDGHLFGDRLYASRGYEGGIAIIDTTKPELIEIVEAVDWLSSCVVAGRAAFVNSSLKGPAVLNLETNDYRRVSVIDFFANDAGTGYAMVRKAIYELDADGKPARRTGLTGELKKAIKNAGHKTILAADDTLILVACDGDVYQLEPGWIPLAPDALPEAEDDEG